ncbi:hypothetical protein PV326_008486, partial [Microctonus aethiopoides]
MGAMRDITNHFSPRTLRFFMRYMRMWPVEVFVELVKLIKFPLNRSEVVNLNAHIERRFWEKTHETADLNILEECNRKKSAGKNASDRTLPLTLHFNFPYTQTPYYEIVFILE